MLIHSNNGSGRSFKFIIMVHFNLIFTQPLLDIMYFVLNFLFQ